MYYEVKHRCILDAVEQTIRKEVFGQSEKTGSAS